ncbi:MAG: TolB-like protein [Candidatus Marivariicella framensis]|jgi:TolB-like protein
MKTSVTQHLQSSGKIAGPLSTGVGLVADVMEPLGPVSWVLVITGFAIMILSYFKWFKVEKKQLIKQKQDGEIDNETFLAKTDQSKWLSMFSFSLIATAILFIFSCLTTISSDRGFMGDNLDVISEMQNSIFNIEQSIDEINQKQDDILESQRKSEQNLQDIKDVVSGDAELKNMSNTGDLSVVKDINERTKDKNVKRVAILYFDNTSDEKKLDKLQKGLAGMLISDLTNVNMLSIVERDRLEEIIKEQKLSRTKAFDPETASKLGKLLGAELILTGAYFEMFGSFRIDARFIDVETGEILKSEGVDGETSNFFKLEKQLAWKIIKNLDVKLSEKEKDDLEEAETEQEVSYETALAYSTALDLIDAGETDKARKKLKAIIVDNPKFKPAKEELRKLQ